VTKKKSLLIVSNESVNLEPIFRTFERMQQITSSVSFNEKNDIYMHHLAIASLEDLLLEVSDITMQLSIREASLSASELHALRLCEELLESVSQLLATFRYLIDSQD
jgi:hypothetical protein